MSEKTIIAWADATFNAVWGCTKHSPGCAHCFMVPVSRRFGHDVAGPNKPRREFGDAHWAEPLQWDCKAAAAGEFQRVFCGSMFDWREDHPQVDAVLPRIHDLWRKTPWSHWLMLTKRAERIKSGLPEDWGPNGYPNVWLGTSIENNDYAWRADELRTVPAVVRFVSYEPALGPLDGLDLSGLDWVIYGGESGPGFRPEDKAWARDMRDRCRESGVAFFHKQSAAFRTEMGIELDGEIIRQFPVPLGFKGRFHENGTGLVGVRQRTISVPNGGPSQQSESIMPRTSIATTGAKYRYHQAASIFPMMTGEPYEAFKADVAKQGQLDPIVLYRESVDDEFEILDGRNLERACLELDIEPHYTEYLLDPIDDPVAFVISRNLHRRHLSKQQRDELMQRQRDDGKTLTAIAKTMNVSHETVRQRTKPTSKKLKVVGEDGKARPQTYKKTEKPKPEPVVTAADDDTDDIAPLPEPAAEPDETSDFVSPMDQLGNEDILKLLFPQKTQDREHPRNWSPAHRDKVSFRLQQYRAVVGKGLPRYIVDPLYEAIRLITQAIRQA